MKYYPWVCNCCEKEFVLTTSFWGGTTGVPWGDRLGYQETPQDAVPRNICNNCALDGVIWAGKQVRMREKGENFNATK